LLEKLNHLEGIHMGLEGLDKQTIGIASLVKKFLGLAGNLSKAAMSPVDPVDGVCDLLVDVVTVFFSLIEVALVDCGNIGKLTNKALAHLLVTGVLVISCLLHV
jgi:hypothetical protein